MYVNVHVHVNVYGCTRVLYMYTYVMYTQKRAATEAESGETNHTSMDEQHHSVQHQRRIQ